MAVTNKDAVKVAVHRRPLQLAVGNVVEQAFAQGVVRAHITNVMHTYIPFVAVAIVAVCKAPGGVVLLEHHHFFTHFAHAGGGGEPANTGADDNGVIGAIKTIGAITAPDTDSTGFGATHDVVSLLCCLFSAIEPSSRSVTTPSVR